MSGAGDEVGRPVVVDSSVVFKWFCDLDESSVQDALRLFEQHASGEVRLVAPAHLPAEVLNGLLSRNVPLTELKGAAIGLTDAEIAYSDWNAELVGSAVELAKRRRLTLNDALFPALALQLDCELVTADRAQARVRECRVRLLR
jgi:predicted nucleic acid-binding protein